MATQSLTHELAQTVSDLSYESLPEHVRIRTKDILLDALASALAGHDSDEIHQITGMAGALGTSAEASVIGGGHLSPAGATLVNSYLITAVTVCDIHRPTSCHVTPEVVAPALVTAELLESSGTAFLTAIAAGLEVTTRIGLGLDFKAFRARGWHTPGVTGPFGGAAAVGRLLGLNADQLCHAFGIAGSQAAGTYAQVGTPTIKFQQARAALGGLMSARLAFQGFESSREILLHPDGGLFSAYCGDGRPDAVLADIGTDWELMRISLRAWPVGARLQPLVTGLLTALQKRAIDPGNVRKVNVRISEPTYRLHGKVPWDDRFRARLSAPYVTGVVIRDRQCWLEQFATVRVRDPALDQFIRERINVQPDPGLDEAATLIEIEMDDGKIFKEHVTAAKGEPSNPLTRQEIINKFQSASAPILSPEAAERAIGLVTNLEAVGNMRELSDCLRGAPGRGPDLASGVKRPGGRR